MLVLHMGMKTDVSKAKMNLSTVGGKLARAIERKGLRAGAKLLQRHAKTLAPVLSGQLKRSIKVRAGRRSRLKQTVNVVVTVPYAKKIEEMYGFVSIAAHDQQPHIIREVHDAIKQELSNL